MPCQMRSSAVLAGFEAIDHGRRTSNDDLIWEGNVQLLEHEQRALVQPNLDGLSCAFARLFSIGSALSFEDRWRWIVTCIVPRFRRLDVHTRLVDASLRRVLDEARDYASNPCVLRSPAHAATNL